MALELLHGMHMYLMHIAYRHAQNSEILDHHVHYSACGARELVRYSVWAHAACAGLHRHA